MSTNEEFDYIIIGAGSAGCVLANRLSADPSVTVCLVEAGASDRTFPVNAQVRIPLAVVTLIANPRHNWMYAYESGARLGGRIVPCPRGRIVGGSSSVNGMIYARGHPADFDHWEALGNSGWGYKDVLPAFLRSENFEGGRSQYHGVGGELHVAAQRSLNPLSMAFMRAAQERGMPLSSDFNAATREGFGLFHVTQKNGERCSSAHAFLHPASTRRNLSVLERTLTLRIDFDGRRAIGVSLLRDGLAMKPRARREVILCAGAVGSPQLLLLSGVGAADMLTPLGIPLVLNLPGVGRNLQDHQDVAVMAKGRTGHSFGLSWRALPWMMAAPFQYLLGRRGPLTSTTIEAGGFVRSRPDLDRPDIELIFAPLLKNQFGRRMPIGHGYTIHVSLLRPASRGRVALKSADPREKPKVTLNFLEKQEDVLSLLSGVRLARQILAAPAFGPYSLQELAPGPGVQSEAALTAFIHESVATTYHAAGSCKMGSDPEAVVDSKLRVHGLAGIRVIDASIMPTVVAAPTNAASIMIGEMGAAFVRQTAG